MVNHGGGPVSYDRDLPWGGFPSPCGRPPLRVRFDQLADCRECDMCGGRDHLTADQCGQFAVAALRLGQSLARRRPEMMAVTATHETTRWLSNDIFAGCPSPVDLSDPAGGDVLWLKFDGKGA